MTLFFYKSDFLNFAGDNEDFVKEIFKDLMFLFRIEKCDDEYKVYWGLGLLATVSFEDEKKAVVVFTKDDYGRAICGLVKDKHSEKFQ